MDDRSRRPTPRRRSFPQLVVLLAAWAGASGCIGPAAIRHTRLRYNEVVRDTNDQQLLPNIVRLRYADSPVFVDLPNITSQFEMAGRGNYLGGYGNAANGRASLGNGDLSLRDAPTLSYHPREGREIAKALLTPLSADLLIVVNAGANLEQLLLFAVDDFNDVRRLPFLMGPDEVRLAPEVRAHSIIADRRDPPGAGGSAGLVPYENAHLEGVASQSLVSSGHLCQDHPAVIREVR